MSVVVRRRLLRLHYVHAIPVGAGRCGAEFAAALGEEPGGAVVGKLFGQFFKNLQRRFPLLAAISLEPGVEDLNALGEGGGVLSVPQQFVEGHGLLLAFDANPIELAEDERAQ